MNIGIVVFDATTILGVLVALSTFLGVVGGWISWQPRNQDPGSQGPKS